MFFCTSLLSCYGKRPISSLMDQYWFNLTGSTFLSETPELPLKAIQFDNGSLIGREIIIEGSIVKVGQFLSHMVLADNTGRMLVVLTDIVEAGKLIGPSENGSMRILGTVERGKKGLPFVQAKSLKKVTPDSKV